MKIAECGFVYMITSPNNKCYVGSSIDIEERWRCYYQLHCKNQIKLLNSFVKYGVESHIFEIVWAGLLIDMYKYETLIGWGFNVLEQKSGLNLKLPKLGDIYSVMSNETKDKIRKGNIGKTMSQESKDKISKFNKGRFHQKETKNKMSLSHKGKKFTELHKMNSGISKKKKIIQYDKLDNFIKEWDSATDVLISLNIDNTSIGECCKGKAKSAGGFKWKYK